MRIDAKAAAEAETDSTAAADAEAEAVADTVSLSSAAEAQPIPPRQLDEYRLVAPLGRGAMGQVYLAYDTLLEREVAIKFFHDPEDPHQERWMTEARAAARLQHPNIAAIYRVGRDAPSNASPSPGEHAPSLPYIVQEYIRGQSLASAPTPMPWQRAYALGLSLSRGLAAAHMAGVLHRDIKPANVMLSESDEPKLVDFGVAKLVNLSAIHEQGAAAKHSAAPGQDAATHGGHPAAGPTATSLTGQRDVVGTPYYMAPEVWRGEGATPRSDVYSFGVLLYELCTGRVPHRDVLVSALPAWLSEHDAPPLARAMTEVDPRFAAVVDRCLARSPSARFASAEELRDALENLDLAGRKPLLPDGNPYRGLLPFEAEHRGVFFGRDTSIRELAERLRHAPLVLVAGESGVGKSSLIRAGLLPYIADHGLGDHRRWDSMTLVPGRRPFSLLMSELSQRLSDGKPGPMAEAAFASEFRQDANTLADHVRRFHGPDRGTVICMDQLEELMTLAHPEESVLACRALACLVERETATRIVATVRGDKITALLRLPELAALMDRDRALYLLRPLTAEEMREAVVGPAQAKGVQFESEALVEALVTATAHGRGGLPLLQFALSQLWHLRDKKRAVIPAAALDAIGGVTGALSRHADGVLRSLLPATREVARRILLCLVTAQGTRGRRTEAELASEIHPADRTALYDLVAGRLVVAHESGGQPVYELAHEALITEWTTLRHWLEEEGGSRAIKERLRVAAAEWEELGKSREALWRGRRLREALVLDRNQLSQLEHEFVLASRRAANRARWLARLGLLAPLLLAALAYGVFQYWQARAANQEIARLIRESDARLAPIVPLRQAYDQAREGAFERFRNGDSEEGDRLWQQALTHPSAIGAGYAQASLPLELALKYAPNRDDVRRRFAALVSAQAELAQAVGDHDGHARLVQRLEAYDDTGAYLARWTAPISVSLTTLPAGLAVKVYRFAPEDSASAGADSASAWALIDQSQDGSTPAAWTLAPGSYRLDLEASGRTVAIRYPLLLHAESRREAALDLALAVPGPDEVPEGFVYIPEGAFLFGYGGSSNLEGLRRWYGALPMHERRTGAYAIARYETTYEAWIEYLKDLPPEERAARLPSGRDPSNETLVELVQAGEDYEWHMVTPSYAFRVKMGEEIKYPGRAQQTRQRWWRFPVTGISGEDAQAYVTWLDRKGKVPGARLCREDEWERAARGADGREFSHGSVLKPEDANFDRTYPKEGMGLDEVGSHPRSVSPFGLEDMVGNAREITMSLRKQGGLVARGGAYFYADSTNVVVNGEVVLATQRLPYLGLRVCADPQRR